MLNAFNRGEKLCIGLIVGLCIALGFWLFWIINFSADEDFGVTVCKEHRVVLAGKVLVTHYYLVDENGHRLSVSSEVFASLVTIPECDAVEE